MSSEEGIKELQRCFSTFGEGYGTEYERYALNRYITHLITRYNVSRVLEMPANGVMGIPGINSLMFAKLGCEVTVAHPSTDFLDAARKMWDAFGLNAHFVRSDWIDSEFEDASFDLVWNFCVYGHFEAPEKVIREMLRVSRRYIFVEFQNVHNPGFHIHRLQHFLQKEPWDHGDPGKLKFSKVRKALEEFRGAIVEVGGLDMPPWPDIPINLKEAFRRGISGLDSSEKIDKEPADDLRPKVTVKDLNEIVSAICACAPASERAGRTLRLFEIWYKVIEKRAPLLLKKAYAHHLYVVAEKRR